MAEALATEMEYEERITEEKKLPGNLTKRDLLQNVSSSTDDVLAVCLKHAIDYSYPNHLTLLHLLCLTEFI